MVSLKHNVSQALNMEQVLEKSKKEREKIFSLSTPFADELEDQQVESQVRLGEILQQVQFTHQKQNQFLQDLETKPVFQATSRQEPK